MATAAPTTPAYSARSAALQTLDSITRYIERHRFSLSDAARLLGRQGHADVLQTELEWLVAKEYLTKQHGIYETTVAGRKYTPENDSDDDELLDAAARDTLPPQPERRDPRDRRR